LAKLPGPLARIWERTTPKPLVYLNLLLIAIAAPIMSLFAVIMAKNVFIMLLPADKIGLVRKDKPKNQSGHDFLVA
jgi:uncharacterized RDD family membrane protein YckC